MNLIQELEAEVNQQAANLSVELIFLLFEKWDREIEQAIAQNKARLPDLLNHYVRLKVTFHHLKKAWDRGWSSLNENQYKTKWIEWSARVKEARRNYYVAKLRSEGEHGSECSCRGCRCVA